MTKSKQIVGLIFWLAITFMTGMIGAIASQNAPEFYRTLTLPNWAPPGWLFGPVWSVLYLLMGLSAWLIWRQDGFFVSKLPLSLYFLQLVANGLWSWLFFRYQSGCLAFYEIIVLWILIVFTIILFWRINTLAGVLLLPYITWVSFAGVLTYAIWTRNPQLLG